LGYEEFSETEFDGREWQRPLRNYLKEFFGNNE
jgi:hypothetical protein